MVLFGILYLVVVLYFSLAYGTYLKFRKNQLIPNGKTKFYIWLLPLILFFVHLTWAISNLKKDYRFSIYILKRLFLTYPEVVGIMIEITLEKLAYNFSIEHSEEKLVKKRRIRKATQKYKTLEINDIRKPLQVLKRYKTALISAS